MNSEAASGKASGGTVGLRGRFGRMRHKGLALVLLIGGLLFLSVFAMNLLSEMTRPYSIDGESPPAPAQYEGQGETVPDASTSPRNSTADQKSAGEADSSTKQGGGDGSGSASTLPPLGEKIIKNGTMTVKVKKNGFDRAYDKALFIASSHGGYIAGSSIRTEEKSRLSGTITLRIPSSKFEKAIGDLRKLGRVEGLEVTSQDFSDEYVDLQARLRSWRGQEAVLLGLMEKAKTIEQSINLQNHLREVQEQIEQITGRIRYLENQTSYSTMQVSIVEKGAASPTPKPAEEWGTTGAFDKAAHAFVDTVNVVIVMVGYLAPWAVAGLLAFLIYRTVRRRKSRNGAPGNGNEHDETDVKASA